MDNRKAVEGDDAIVGTNDDDNNHCTGTLTAGGSVFAAATALSVYGQCQTVRVLSSSSAPAKEKTLGRLRREKRERIQTRREFAVRVRQQCPQQHGRGRGREREQREEEGTAGEKKLEAPTLDYAPAGTSPPTDITRHHM